MDRTGTDFEQEQTEQTEFFFKNFISVISVTSCAKSVSVSSVASCEEVTKVEGRGTHSTGANRGNGESFLINSVISVASYEEVTSDEGRVKNKGDEAKRREWLLFSSPRHSTPDTAQRACGET